MSTDGKKLKVVKIVPAERAEGDGPYLARGTKIILSDGSELSHVTAVTLRAEAGGVWRACIEVFPQEIPEIFAEGTIIESTALADDTCSYGRIGQTQPEGE